MPLVCQYSESDLGLQLSSLKPCSCHVKKKSLSTTKKLQLQEKYRMQLLRNQYAPLKIIPKPFREHTATRGSQNDFLKPTEQSTCYLLKIMKITTVKSSLFSSPEQAYRAVKRQVCVKQSYTGKLSFSHTLYGIGATIKIGFYQESCT